ncbi:nucleotidyltransferase family protein [Azospirillum sp. RWY-5-1]|uniref:Nucleotidyltransferase family protein n=1 Tax=Azospirillum oleiclasticum TaxID=2735135 RepID=A0ABX2TBH0_9PROT|nr:nucleotidyltransferase family protein [Azospirillum oleiclasticum]NYZ13332.1 nucleotidyltransferase family protein [Azospirillum oleiclasticum]NYZ20493.1 nucleotidyltransferase family protein [Azospirillum oleiclasticum]
MSATHGSPKTAMVLAAGLGLRMRPLTLDRPKPLIPVAGRALLDHALDRLVDAGVETAVVNSHYLGGMITAHLAGRRDLHIVPSPEETPLDTGGAVRRALPHLGTEPVLTVNADILWLDGPTPALRRLAANWDPERMDALLLLMATTKSVGYDGRGDFHMDPLGLLSRRGESEIAPFVYAGVQIVKPALFGQDTPDGAFSTNLVWDRAMEAGRLYGLAHDGAWFHVGTPDALVESEELLAQGGMRWIGP